MIDARIQIGGETLHLLPERAALWEGAATLLVADPHWGKTTTFRAAGVAVPGGTTADDFARLSAVLARAGARRLVILGDLFHARSAQAPHVIAAAREWRARHGDVEVILVPGNHDRHAGRPPAELGFRVVEPGHVEAPFVLAHHPEPAAEGYVLAGHLHPALVLRGRGRQRERLPCFHFGERVGVLPAFGSFTGMAEIHVAPGDRVWVIAGDEVLRAPTGGG